jgi:mannose-6-phosphate isomerase-like protein (cupin superfamily)
MIADSLVTVSVATDYDVLAPDGSEIRILSQLSCGGMAHGTLPPGRTSLAVRHRTVAEIWFALGGSAEIWRRLGDIESVETVLPGQSLTIPTGTEFQFRTSGPEPFTFIMCTMPPWPGPDEAEFVEGAWKVSNDAL